MAAFRVAVTQGVRRWQSGERAGAGRHGRRRSRFLRRRAIGTARRPRRCGPRWAPRRNSRRRNANPRLHHPSQAPQRRRYAAPPDSRNERLRQTGGRQTRSRRPLDRRRQRRRPVRPVDVCGGEEYGGGGEGARCGQSGVSQNCQRVCSSLEKRQAILVQPRVQLASAELMYTGTRTPAAPGRPCGCVTQSPQDSLRTVQTFLSQNGMSKSHRPRRGYPIVCPAAPGSMGLPHPNSRGWCQIQVPRGPQQL